MRLTVLTETGELSYTLLNWLSDSGFTDIEVIFEDPLPRKTLIRYRLRKLGVLTTFGQLVFIAFVQRILSRRSASRKNEILQENGLRSSEPVAMKVKYVNSVNDEATATFLQERKPDAVLVFGTRIIGGHILECVSCEFINIHMGITPRYRGVHGGYWALWNSDSENFGTTIHLVDKGVDTGYPLAWVRALPSQADNITTYPFLQLASCLHELKSILELFANIEIKNQDENLTSQSRQWYHPTIFQYFLAFLRGVK